LQIGGGVLSDCWRKNERGAATAVYSVMPFIGPAIGPIGMIPLYHCKRKRKARIWTTASAMETIQKIHRQDIYCVR
jgi:hypothetical protein